MQKHHPQVSPYLKKYSGNKSPGVAWAFSDPKREILICEGFSDIKRKHLVNEKTTFNLYSVTKTFTALCIMQLHERGLLSIDDRASEYLEDLPIDERVRIRYLLSHMSGFVNPMPLSWIHLAGEHAAFDFTGFADTTITQYSTLRYEPGLRYSYSNIGYLVLGRIIEQVSGLSYQEYVKENIFDKLKIPPEDLSFEIHDEEIHATGYEKRLSFWNLILGLFIKRKKYSKKPVKKWRPYHPFLLHGTSFGGLTGNVKGLIPYLEDLMKEDSRLLGKEAKKALFEKQKTRKKTETGTTLGWFSGELNGHRYFCHAGGGGGYYSEIRIYPDLEAASVVCMNKSAMRDLRFLDKTDKFMI